ncbi:ABC transporter ATP-binding protein [uncultured Desulfovibrio sp.]|uniref:ABC transporter ATP-binding protein n=1 Tax=uncultured Desulfovibrio sp. TaxID=167968 RepID=UPI002608B906|nr:ABC transporter ATP-binding protein [uncultured Desulfovibrio sp.]
MDTKEGHLEIINASKVYDPEGVNVLAVDNCSFEIQAGEFVAIVGPSGCGKTTLLNMTAGFESISQGEIRMDGKVIAAPGQPPRPGSDRVVVFQAGALFDWMTVRQNIMFGPLVTGSLTESEAGARAMELIRMAGLKGYENAYPIHISSGMKRRVEILRALINEPKTLLLDEPYRAMDAITKSVMHQFLLDMFDRVHKTVLFITHDLDEAIYLSDKVGIMTTRPGRFKKWIHVDLPRPRTFRTKKLPEFLEYKRQTIEAVREEARKSFERGEREGA